MEAILREKPKAVLKQLKYLRAVGDIASKLGWDRLRVLLILEKLAKAGLAKRVGAESYELTAKGEKTLERLEAGERLAELPKIEPWKKFKWDWKTKKWEMR